MKLKKQDMNLARVNAKDGDTSLRPERTRLLASCDEERAMNYFSPWRRELDLPVYPSWSQERRVENVDAVRRHDDLEQQ